MPLTVEGATVPTQSIQTWVLYEVRILEGPLQNKKLWLLRVMVPRDAGAWIPTKTLSPGSRKNQTIDRKASSSLLPMGEPQPVAASYPGPAR
jgi:hypothetical protein